MSIRVSNIWQLGLRLFHGDHYVQMHDFETEACDFLFRHTNDPTIGIQTDAFCKRVNWFYKQRIDELEALGERLKKTGEFENVEMKVSPSATGLPYTLAYTHKETRVDTTFDGILFVSEKIVQTGEFGLIEARDMVQKLGMSFWKDDIAQTGTAHNNDLWDHLALQASRCSWHFTTGSAAYDQDAFRFNIPEERVILYFALTDHRIFRATFPTGEGSNGESFSFFIGHHPHIRQVLAQNYESYRYLSFLQNRVQSMREKCLAVNEKYHKAAAPLVPDTLRHMVTPALWFKALRHWTQVHRDLETLLSQRHSLTPFVPILEAYRAFASKGVCFYSMVNPIQVLNAKGEHGPAGLAQYPTPAPQPITVTDNRVTIGDYEATSCVFSKYPERLIDFAHSTRSLIDEAYDAVRDLAGTAASQFQLAACVVSLVALVVALVSGVMSLLALFQSK